VLCIPGLNKLDAAAALVLAQTLRRQGVGAVAESADALSISKFFALDLSGVSLICLCYVNTPSNAKVQYAVRRLSRKGRGVPVVIALLGDAANGENAIGSVANATVVQGGFGAAAASVIETGADGPVDLAAVKSAS
jgi:hypothetical protein